MATGAGGLLTQRVPRRSFTTPLTATPMLRLFAVLLLAAAPVLAQPDTLRTGAERSDYRATSTYDEVVGFVRALEEEPGFGVIGFGQTVGGRSLPVVMWNAAKLQEQRQWTDDRLRVLVVANIHAGEVAGKEAALMLFRELATGEHTAWADSLALFVFPIYNADGNEIVDARNRPYQHGPVDGMGQRPNAQGLDLNRDFVKLDAPESRALLGVMNAYDPHVVIDLHTTNGTVHGYHLTYAPPLHPNTAGAIDSLLRNAWLPDVTKSYRERYGWDLMYYGNTPPEDIGAPMGWYTFDPRPRFGTNYVGLRNRVAILSEAYSYATFEDRVTATLRFLTETLDWAHAHAGEIRRAVEQAGAEPVVGDSLFLRSAETWAADDEPHAILLGEVVEEPNPHTGEPMLRRTEVQTPTEMPVYGRFSGAELEAVPEAYVIPETLAAVLDRLESHGIYRFKLRRAVTVQAEAFRVDSVRVAEQPFQDRYEQELFGRYEPETLAVAPGTSVVLVNTSLGRLAFTLLEPRSDGGFASWGLIKVEAGETYPIRRVLGRDAAEALRDATAPQSRR